MWARRHRQSGMSGQWGLGELRRIRRAASPGLQEVVGVQELELLGIQDEAQIQIFKMCNFRISK